MTTSTARPVLATDVYRVWVGCLGCYNNGSLLGDWFDADICPDDMESFNEDVKVPSSHIAEGHEEIWVFDHEESPVDGEYSPATAREYADWLKGLLADELPALRAFLSDRDYSWSTLQEFRDAYVGEFRTPAKFAMEMADRDGFFDNTPAWPSSCVDWDHAARELMYDYFEENGYYFRSM